MKIVVLSTMAPFVYGGAEFLAEELAAQLTARGHQAQLIRLPFSWEPPENILDCMTAARLTRVVNSDLLIAMKFPAYLAPHPRKSLWLIHQLRQAYDLAGTEYDFFSADPSHQAVKKAVVAADNYHLGSLDGPVYTISPVVSDRLKKYNDIDSSYLFHPLKDQEKFHFRSLGDFIFYPSRVNHSKRQHLAVEAMRHVRTPVKLLLAGKGDSPDDEKAIWAKIKDFGLQKKVTYLDRFISQEEKIDFFSRCLGGMYLPYQEDTYGYSTVEALYSAKPAITCTDSGGTTTVVKDGQTGYLADPEPRALAEAMDRLYDDRKQAETMGRNGLELLHQMDISWDKIVRSLVP